MAQRAGDRGTKQNGPVEQTKQEQTARLLNGPTGAGYNGLIDGPRLEASSYTERNAAEHTGPDSVKESPIK